MILTFNATECGMMIENGTIICGSSNANSNEENHSLIICGPEKNDSTNDYEVYFEIDDQSLGGHNNIKVVSIAGNHLKIIPSEQSDIPYAEINVNLGCQDESIEEFKEGLRLIFRNSTDKLNISK